MTSDNIMLTGLPRGGTTLVCRLLNKLDNTVALVEPMAVGEFPRLPTRAAILDVIEQFAEEQRRSLCKSGRAVTRHVDGSVSDNLFAPQRSTDGLRPFLAKHGTIRFDKPLTADLKLIIKHPAVFTALLPELAARFTCYAVIRNPVSALASWNSTKMPVNDGRAPAAEQHDPRLKQALSTLEDRFERQLFLLNWYFEQYRRHLPENRILRYEDIITSGGAVLAAIAPSAASLDEDLKSQNRSEAYDWDEITPLADKLLAAKGACCDFYSRDDIYGLLQ